MHVDGIDGDDDLVIDIEDDTVDLGGSGGGDDKLEGAAPPAKKVAPEEPSDEEKERQERETLASRRAAEIERERDAERERAARAEALAAAADERRREAEQMAARREDQAMRAHWARLNSDLRQVEAAITSTSAEALAAERDYARAIEEGDTAASAAAQRALARAEAALSQLEAGKAQAERDLETTRASFEEHYRARALAAEEAAKAPPPETKRSEPEPPKTPDEWIDRARSAIGDRTAEWLSQNKQFVTDEKLHRKFLRFTEDYVDDHGRDALRSADFADALQKRFFGESADIPETRGRDAGDKPAIRQPSRSTTSAPVSRGSQFFSSRNPNARQVRLPPALARQVREMGLDPAEYARAAVEDIKNGKLPKNFLDSDYPHEA